MSTLAERYNLACKGQRDNLIGLVNNAAPNEVAAVTQNLTTDHAVIRFHDRSRILLSHDGSITVRNTL